MDTFSSALASAGAFGALALLALARRTSCKRGALSTTPSEQDENDAKEYAMEHGCRPLPHDPTRKFSKPDSTLYWGLHQGFLAGLAKGREGMVPASEMERMVNDAAPSFMATVEMERLLCEKKIAEAVAQALKADRERCMRIVSERCDYADSIKGSDTSSLIMGIKYSAMMLIRVPGSVEGAMQIADAETPKADE